MEENTSILFSGSESLTYQGSDEYCSSSSLCPVQYTVYLRTMEEAWCTPCCGTVTQCHMV